MLVAEICFTSIPKGTVLTTRGCGPPLPAAETSSAWEVGALVPSPLTVIFIRPRLSGVVVDVAGASPPPPPQALSSRDAHSNNNGTRYPA